ncbi:MAG: hypothetical protein CMJ76_10230 [Planctomycetaceae bacterium]|nr:hypothetical protein [Planctomycetaceae bacterium]
MFWGKTLGELFEQGGFVMYPLLVCSIVAVSVVIERIIVLFLNRSNYAGFVSDLENKLTHSDISSCREWLQALSNPLAHVASCNLKHAELGQGIREEIVNREASEQIARLEKRINWLSIIGTLAPMIGLLGTVIGLVEAFYQIEQQGGQVQPGDLASGIWTALLTTVFGLIVALPTLAVYHFLDNKMAATTLKMTWVSSRINEWLATQNQSENETLR